jgi:PilZ domain
MQDDERILPLGEEWPKDSHGPRALTRWHPFAVFVERGGQTLSPLVRDVTPSGMQLRWDGDPGLAAGDELEVRVDGYGPLSAEVRWIRGEEIGLAFSVGAGEAVAFRQWLNLLRLAKERLEMDEDC